MDFNSWLVKLILIHQDSQEEIYMGKRMKEQLFSEEMKSEEQKQALKMSTHRIQAYQIMRVL